MIVSAATENPLAVVAATSFKNVFAACHANRGGGA
jgi:hypothetical protein